MKKLMFVLAGAASLMVSVTAQAQMVRAQDPASVVRALQDAGYKADLSADSSGDPMIKSSSGGSNFSIFFYGCTDNEDCRTVQFYAGWSDPENASLRAMNDWNRDNRFGRAYVSDDGSARIEMDVDLDDGGMSRLLFQDNVEFWEVIMAKFKDYISE